MAIELSSLTFTDRADVVPASGVEQILNTGIANTLAGNDIIIGTSTISDFNTVGINNYSGVMNTGDGDDTLIGTSTGVFGYGIQNYNSGIINTGAGNDTIIAIGPTYGIYNFNVIETGGGDDIITATGDDGIVNGGSIDTGDGRDIITGTAKGGDFGGIFNNIDGIINTGNGSDVITGIGVIGIYNDGIIDTGNGEDSIIAYGGFSGIGSVLLGNGKDYLKGFGSGNFNGGNGKDALELTSGSYTVGISGTAVNFTKGSVIMYTSDFEKLIAGSTAYDFSSLTDGQTISVA
jgi:hypothetical protein